MDGVIVFVRNSRVLHSLKYTLLLFNFMKLFSSTDIKEARFNVNVDIDGLGLMSAVSHCVTASSSHSQKIGRRFSCSP